jgi:hypothetical protein
VTILSISFRVHSAPHYGRPGFGLTIPILQHFLHPFPRTEAGLRRGATDLRNAEHPARKFPKSKRKNFSLQEKPISSKASSQNADTRSPRI